MTLLRAAFPGRLISRFGDVSWPPRSPDLTSPDFILWGYLKGKVYRNRPNNLQELKKEYYRRNQHDKSYCFGIC